MRCKSVRRSALETLGGKFSEILNSVSLSYNYNMSLSLWGHKDKGKGKEKLKRDLGQRNYTLPLSLLLIAGNRPLTPPRAGKTTRWCRYAPRKTGTSSGSCSSSRIRRP